MTRLPSLYQDGPNAVTITIGDIDIAFSYRTPIGYRTDATGWRVRENNWGPTTGKHLNNLPNGARDKRVPSDQFERELAAVIAGMAQPDPLFK